MSTPTQPDLYRTARAAAAWLNAANGRDRHELQSRILKLSEEVGEVAAAWIGATGQNPRKGTTHTMTDVADELADVCMTGLVAIASIGFDPAVVMARLIAKITARLPRDTPHDPGLERLNGRHTVGCLVLTLVDPIPELCACGGDSR
jgi:NTP pyrophosphatase (non-canonical NTP hydrolase)